MGPEPQGEGQVSLFPQADLQGIQTLVTVPEGEMTREEAVSGHLTSLLPWISSNLLG